MTLKNAYKDRKAKPNEEVKKVPQSFTFVCRQSLPRRGIDLDMEERVPRQLRQEDTSNDVFALLKLNMSSKELSQRPLLVYPASLLPETEHFWGRVNSTNMAYHAELEPERKAELEELAAALERDFPHYTRAVDFYRKLVKPDEGRYQPYPEIKFLRYPKASRRWCDLNLGERPLPPKPHHLQVVFHRKQA